MGSCNIGSFFKIIGKLFPELEGLTDEVKVAQLMKILQALCTEICPLYMWMLTIKDMLYTACHLDKITSIETWGQRGLPFSGNP